MSPEVLTLSEQYGIKPYKNKSEWLDAVATAILTEDRKEQMRGGGYRFDELNEWLSPHQLKVRRRREELVSQSAFHSYDGASVTVAPHDSPKRHQVQQVWPRGNFKGEEDQRLRKTVCDMPKCHILVTPRKGASGGWGLCNRHYQRVRHYPHLVCEFDVNGVRCAGDRHLRLGGIYYCTRHYARAKRYGDPTILKQPPPGKAQYQTCSIPGCNREHVAKGLCRPHWHRQHRTGEVTDSDGSLEIGARYNRSPKCSAEDCDEPRYSKGLCKKCYERMAYRRRKDREMGEAA